VGCERIQLNGGAIFACTRGADRPRCYHCKRFAELVCDYPLTGTKAGSTCDRLICAKCAVGTETGQLCPAHGRVVAKAAKEVHRE
jgi:hypothetical protein